MSKPYPYYCPMDNLPTSKVQQFVDDVGARRVSCRYGGVRDEKGRPDGTEGLLLGTITKDVEFICEPDASGSTLFLGELNFDFRYEGGFEEGRFNDSGKYDVQEWKWSLDPRTEELPYPRYGANFVEEINPNEGSIHYDSSKMFTGTFTYEGGFKEGRFHGRGKYEDNNGDWYDGHWEDGKPHGIGIVEFATGTIYGGDWKYGKPDGIGVLKFRSYVKRHPSKSSMPQSDLEKHGAPKNRFEGHWKNGVRHGVILSGGMDGTSSLGIWKNGRLFAKSDTKTKKELELEVLHLRFRLSEIDSANSL